MNRKIKVCWMYHDIMDLYGDKGNMIVLEKRCKDRGIEFELDTCAIGDNKDLSKYNLVFLGGGDDKAQLSMLPDLLSRKDNIKKAMDENTFILLICGGYQLFGKYYVTSSNEKVEGLGFYDYYTDVAKDNSRCVGNIAIDVDLDGIRTRIIGFENHGGQTKNVAHPLGKVVKGHGNSFDAGFEGFYDGKILGTYLHGPLLPKNSVIADFVICKALQKNDSSFKYDDLTLLKNPFEDGARKQMFDRMGI